MNSPWQGIERQWEEDVARRLREEGYEVMIAPRREQLPFEMAGYKPDLVAKRDDGGLIIELKRSEQRTVVEKYVEVAALVRRHPGWRFLLIPVDRLTEGAILDISRLSSWHQIREHARVASALLEAGQQLPAFLTAWSGLEGALRRIGEGRGVPVAALSTTALSKHLYSLGVVSMDEFSRIQYLTAVRDNAVHGLADGRVKDGAGEAIQLLDTLLIRRTDPRSHD